MIKEKKCSTCKEIKDIGKFRKDSTRKDGYQYMCKSCRRVIDSNYYKNNKRKLLDSNNRYRNKRKKLDPVYRFKSNLRVKLYKSFKKKKWKKDSTTAKLLGGSYELVISHIENQFSTGMSWDNYGRWHIDHKIPLAQATTIEEIKDLCHYSNLQPLWAEDNRKKRDKIM